MQDGTTLRHKARARINSSVDEAVLAGEKSEDDDLIREELEGGEGEDDEAKLLPQKGLVKRHTNFSSSQVVILNTRNSVEPSPRNEANHSDHVTNNRDVPFKPEPQYAGQIYYCKSPLSAANEESDSDLEDSLISSNSSDQEAQDEACMIFQRTEQHTNLI